MSVFKIERVAPKGKALINAMQLHFSLVTGGHNREELNTIFPFSVNLRALIPKHDQTGWGHVRATAAWTT